jgi:predicted regulator of Ras-like GTPase activity (Roadblock/LC7/MglB family)
MLDAMFKELLDRVLHETPGAFAVTLMGFDGIAIETREGPGAEPGQAHTAAVELGNIASQLRRVSAGMGTGDMSELTVHTSSLTTVLRPLTDEYFVAVCLTPGGSSGKGRYLLRVVGPRLTKELV